MEEAERKAHGRGLRLTAEHWRVLCRAREECLSGLRVPDVGALARAAGLAPADIERLFPGDACALVVSLAGIDQPPCGGDS